MSEWSIVAWSQDFTRAFRARPRIVRWIILRLLGRYARNELIGLAASLYVEYGIPPEWGYNLEGMGYHKDIDLCKFDDIQGAARIIWPQHDDSN